MDRLRLCLETLRRLAKETEDPNCVVLAEREINDYLQNEIDALRAALERLGKAIDEEARKGQGEDWSLMVGYVQSCLEKLPGAIDEWRLKLRRADEGRYGDPPVQRPRHRVPARAATHSVRSRMLRPKIDGEISQSGFGHAQLGFAAFSSPGRT